MFKEKTPESKSSDPERISSPFFSVNLEGEGVSYLNNGCRSTPDPTVNINKEEKPHGFFGFLSRIFSPVRNFGKKIYSGIKCAWNSFTGLFRSKPTIKPEDTVAPDPLNQSIPEPCEHEITELAPENIVRRQRGILFNDSISAQIQDSTRRYFLSRMHGPGIYNDPRFKPQNKNRPTIKWGAFHSLNRLQSDTINKNILEGYRNYINYINTPKFLSNESVEIIKNTLSNRINHPKITETPTISPETGLSEGNFHDSNVIPSIPSFLPDSCELTETVPSREESQCDAHSPEVIEIRDYSSAIANLERLPTDDLYNLIIKAIDNTKQIGFLKKKMISGATKIAKEKFVTIIRDISINILREPLVAYTILEFDNVPTSIQIIKEEAGENLINFASKFVSHEAIVGVIKNSMALIQNL